MKNAREGPIETVIVLDMPLEMSQMATSKPVFAEGALVDLAAAWPIIDA